MTSDVATVAYYTQRGPVQRDLPLGVLTEEAIEAAQYGQCVGVAIELARLMGMGEVLVYREWHPFLTGRDNARTLHAVVRHPDQYGMCIDSYGPRPCEELEADFRWERLNWFADSLSVEDLAADDGRLGPGMLPQNFEFARELARAVLEEHGLTHLIVAPSD